MRKGEKLPGGHEKLAEEIETLEVFKPSKFAGELHIFMEGVQEAFENNLSLERINCTKCTKKLRTCQTPEDEEVTHC